MSARLLLGPSSSIDNEKRPRILHRDLGSGFREPCPLFGRNPAGLLIKVASNSVFARAAVIARETAKSNYPRHALTIVIVSQ